MDSTCHKRVTGDPGSRPNNPISVNGGQASHAPLIHKQGQET